LQPEYKQRKKEEKNEWGYRKVKESGIVFQKRVEVGVKEGSACIVGDASPRI